MKDQLKQVVLRVFNVNGIRQMAPDGSREADGIRVLSKPSSASLQ